MVYKKGKAKCSFSFTALHSDKEENTELINGCIEKGVWEKITSSEEYKKIESMELEELEAYLDPSFFPEGCCCFFFTPETEKENCENSFAMVKFASFEPESATANKEGTWTNI